jgi:hypothetical protein
MSYEKFRHQYPTIHVAYERWRLDGTRSMILIDDHNGLEQEVFIHKDLQPNDLPAHLLEAGQILASKRRT